jgi:hypothetical protein
MQRREAGLFPNGDSKAQISIAARRRPPPARQGGKSAPAGGTGWMVGH